MAVLRERERLRDEARRRGETRGSFDEPEPIAQATNNDPLSPVVVNKGQFAALEPAEQRVFLRSILLPKLTHLIDGLGHPEEYVGSIVDILLDTDTQVCLSSFFLLSLFSYVSFYLSSRLFFYLHTA